jgi:hypothetical protein
VPGIARHAHGRLEINGSIEVRKTEESGREREKERRESESEM